MVDQVFSSDCLSIPQSLCLDEGSYIIGPEANEDSLIGYWSFDGTDTSDHTSNSNAMTFEEDYKPTVGPAMMSRGFSMNFDGLQQAKIAHISSYETNDVTYTLWFYLRADSTGAWRTIFHKGDTLQEMTTSLYLWPKERRLHARASTDEFWSEGIDSHAAIGLRRWTHITVATSGELMKLYINGREDKSTVLDATIKWNNGPIYVGKDPWHAGTKCYIDELRLYSGMLKERDIESLAAPALADAGIFNF